MPRRGFGKSGSPGRFALPAWEFPTFWEERLGGDGSPYLGREFSVVWATKARGREQGCSRYYWALMWKGLGLARAVLIMIKMLDEIILERG